MRLSVHLSSAATPAAGGGLPFTARILETPKGECWQPIGSVAIVANRSSSAAGSCPWCGATFSGTRTVELGAAGAASGRNEGVMIGIVAVLVLALVLIATLLITSGNGNSGQVSTADRQSPSNQTQGDGASPNTSATTSSTTTTTTTSTTFPTTTTPSTLPPDVRTLPSGLTCGELAVRGYPYPAAVTYWQIEGQPARMDVDNNGRPCETVYPPAAVAAFWHQLKNRVRASPPCEFSTKFVVVRLGALPGRGHQRREQKVAGRASDRDPVVAGGGPPPTRGPVLERVRGDGQRDASCLMRPEVRPSECLELLRRLADAVREADVHLGYRDTVRGSQCS